MNNCRFRPELWEVEDRITPATTATDVSNGLATTPVVADVLVSVVAADYGVLTTADTQSTARVALTTLEGVSAAAVTPLGDYFSSLAAAVQQNPALAESFAPAAEQVAAAYFQASANQLVAHAFGVYIDEHPAASTSGTGTTTTDTGTTGTGTSGTGTTGTGTTGTSGTGTTGVTGTSTSTTTSNGGTTSGTGSTFNGSPGVTGTTGSGTTTGTTGGSTSTTTGTGSTGTSTGTTTTGTGM